MRRVTHRYADPLARVWVAAARRIGLTLRRTDDAFATTDGRGELALGTDETLDADDCLAQMIFHELCHSLVQGPESFELPDWGLDNETDRDLELEHACLRLQAYLGSRHGLREVLAPTTDHRAFYDGLGSDPLAGNEASAVLARLGLARVERDPWAPHLGAALEATERIARLTAEHGLADGSIWELVGPPRPRHPAGGWVHPASEGRCAGCAWCPAPEPAGEARCRARGEVRVDPSWPACERFVPELECGACGACCREAYDQVELEPGEPFGERHRALVTSQGERRVILRVAGRCPALDGDGVRSPYLCRHYADRPRSCRDFERGGANCYAARRRVGMTA